MNVATLTELYVAELQDMHSAEKQLVRALPRLAKAAASPELAQAFESHLAETEEQLERLERILRDLGRKPGGMACEAMKGLVAEGDDMAKARGEDSVRDAGLIVAAQKVEHYEIATYGSLCTFAKLLERDEDLGLLKQSIQEEKNADAALTNLAVGAINVQAAAA